jgi:ribonuclease HI
MSDVFNNQVRRKVVIRIKRPPPIINSYEDKIGLKDSHTEMRLKDLASVPPKKLISKETKKPYIDNGKTVKNVSFIIYTDGSYHPQGYCGAWAYVIKLVDKDNKKRYIWRSNHDGKLNVSPTFHILFFECSAAIKALEYIEEFEKEYDIKIHNITIRSDSKQVVECLERINRYMENDWKYLNNIFNTSNEKEMPDDMKIVWLDLGILALKHDVKFEKVTAHKDVKYNNMANDIAKRDMIKTLRKGNVRFTRKGAEERRNTTIRNR